MKGGGGAEQKRKKQTIAALVDFPITGRTDGRKRKEERKKEEDANDAKPSRWKA